MLNKACVDSMHDKLTLIEESVNEAFHSAEIGLITKQAIQSLEFKQDSEIVHDLSTLQDSEIISTALQSLKTKLQIEWNAQQQQKFHALLQQAFAPQAPTNDSDEKQKTDEETAAEVGGLDEDNKRKGVLVLGGSFSPCHTEHVELLNEIKNYLATHEQIQVIAAYLVVTTDHYVYGKLQDAAIKYEHRRKICELTAAKYAWCHASHVPQISGAHYATNILTKENFAKHFADNPWVDESERASLLRINCMGADKINARFLSGWNSYSNLSITCCIARKGYNEDIQQTYEAAKADGKCQGFVFVPVECKPISSTLIRTHLLKLRSALCESNKDDHGWKLKKKVSEKKSAKYKQAFRDGVREMLDAQAVEYLIEHIAELWYVPEYRMVGVGKSLNVPTNSARKKNKSAQPADGDKKKKWWHFGHK